MCKMNINKSLGDIDNEFLGIVRDELEWLYNKLDSIDQKRMEKKLICINRMFITILTTTLTEKQVLRETQSFDEMINLFKISRN